MASMRDGWAQVLRRPERHVAQLYRSSAFLAEAVGLFLAEGIRLGETAIVIAMPEHDEAIRAGMQRHGVQPDELCAAGRLVLCDAATTLATFMRDGHVDRALVAQGIGGLLRRLGASGARMRAYGEMVMLLWREGNATAAVELEHAWNALVDAHPLSLLCGYQLDGVAGAYPNFADACGAHVQVLPSENFLELAATERLGVVAHLEQEAREARAREQFIKSIVDSSRDCIKVLDLEARLLFMNQGGMATLELCDFAAARGQCWLDFWQGADRMAAAAAIDAAKAGRTSEFVGYFETMVTKQPRWWSVVVSPIRDDQDRVHQILAVSRDVTDRKRLEDDLRCSIEARDQFVSIASHELRTPITSLLLQLEMSRTRLADAGALSPDRVTRLLDVCTRQAERLAKLVESMLGVSAVHAGRLAIEPRRANLSHIATTVYERFRDQLAASGAQVVLDLAPDLMGSWDPNRLEQVIENLLANALKYAPGAAITLATRRSEHGAQLVIADLGPGIPPAKQHLIFERFERVGSARSVGGLGLGLFIVKQLVEAHGGRIRVETPEGGGATFIIDLPLENADTAPTA